MMYPLIAPSILSADFTDIASALRAVEESGSDWVHLDIMDGQFVPPITFGAKMVGDIRARTALPLDVHLMTAAPERLVADFAAAGADYITFHAEACVHAHRLVQAIRGLGKKAGISIVPSTPVSAIVELLPFLDLVLVMTVNPGYGGQAMLPFCLEKVKQLKALRTSAKLGFLIEIDGGAGLDTLGRITAAGPEVLALGSAFFAAGDKAGFVRALRSGYSEGLVC